MYHFKHFECITFTIAVAKKTGRVTCVIKSMLCGDKVPHELDFADSNLADCVLLFNMFLYHP